MTYRKGIALALSLTFLGWTTFLTAADKGAEKPDPTGTWKWSVMPQDGQKIATTLKLKMDGTKLTGTIIGMDKKEIPIEDVQFKDGMISFKAERERMGQKFTVKYKGKLSGDTIKGKIDVDLGGQELNFDWDAKREKAVEKKK